MNKIRKPMRGWLRVLLIIIPFFVFMGVAQMIAMLVLGLKPSNHQSELTTFQSTVAMLFTVSATFGIVAIFRRNIDRASFRSLGFGMKNIKRELVTGFALGFFLIAAGFVLLLLSKEISWVGINLDLGNLLLSVVLFTAVAFNEELLMRGYILNNLMLSMNRWVALLVSALIFSSLHLANPNITFFSFSSIFLAGFLLGLPYIYTKSLWLPIAFHLSWNYFQGTIFGYRVSGNSSYSLITQSRTSDTIWNGGEFGFEGSIIAFLFLCITIIVLWLYYKKREAESTVNAENETATEVAQDLPAV